MASTIEEDFGHSRNEGKRSGGMRMRDSVARYRVHDARAQRKPCLGTATSCSSVECERSSYLKS